MKLIKNIKEKVNKNTLLLEYRIIAYIYAKRNLKFEREIIEKLIDKLLTSW